MEQRGYSKWQGDDLYHADQIESILIHLNVNIVNETETNFLCLCPFHNNNDTPAMSVAKETGMFLCFAPHCGERGNVTQLVQRVGTMDQYQSRRFIEKFRKNVDMASILARSMEQPVEFKEFDQALLDKFKEDFPGSEAQNYMWGRKFNDTTLETFDVGYSAAQNMVVVPMHDPSAMPLGVIGRSLTGKQFKNTPGLPKSKTAFNFHRAKKASETVIIVESSMDAMRVHQSGFPNVIALLGGFISQHHVAQINKAFNSIIIFTDNDEAGRTLGRSIEDKLSNKRILWAADSPDAVYPADAKDAGDLEDSMIANLVRTAIDPITYQTWYN